MGILHLSSVHHKFAIVPDGGKYRLEQEGPRDILRGKGSAAIAYTTRHLTSTHASWTVYVAVGLRTLLSFVLPLISHAHTVVSSEAVSNTPSFLGCHDIP